MYINISLSLDDIICGCKDTTTQHNMAKQGQPNELHKQQLKY